MKRVPQSLAAVNEECRILPQSLGWLPAGAESCFEHHVLHVELKMKIQLFLDVVAEEYSRMWKLDLLVQFFLEPLQKKKSVSNFPTEGRTNRRTNNELTQSMY